MMGTLWSSAAMMSETPFSELRRAPRRTGALLYIAAHPEASNREVADGIGIGDDAQISRLLARMKDLGLVHNRAGVGNHGGANAWQLTAEGRRLLSAVKGSRDQLTPSRGRMGAGPQRRNDREGCRYSSQPRLGKS